MDKPWAERLGGASYDDLGYNDEFRNWNVLQATAKVYEKPLPIPQPRLSSAPTWDDHGNAWSAALGAMFGAGTVLVLAAIFLLWKRPRKRETPVLAPLDVGHNKSVEETEPEIFQSPVTELDESLMSCDGSESGRNDTKLNVNLAPRHVQRDKSDLSDICFEPEQQSSPNKICPDASTMTGIPENSSTVMLHIKEMFTSLTGNIKTLSDSVEACRNKVAAVRSEVAEIKDTMNQRFEKNEAEISELRHEIEFLRSELGHRDRMQLLNNVEISGVTEHSGENLNQVVTVITTKLGMTIDARDIDYVARAGPRRAEEGGQPARPRPVVVRFTRRAPRDELLRTARARRNLTTDQIGVPGERRPVYINEHLTKSDRQLFGKARSLAREENYKYVWKKNGRIFIRKVEGGTVYHIQSESDLFQFKIKK